MIGSSHSQESIQQRCCSSVQLDVASDASLHCQRASCRMPLCNLPCTDRVCVRMLHSHRTCCAARSACALVCSKIRARRFKQENSRYVLATCRYPEHVVVQDHARACERLHATERIAVTARKLMRATAVPGTAAPTPLWVPQPRRRLQSRGLKVQRASPHYWLWPRAAAHGRFRRAHAPRRAVPLRSSPARGCPR